MIHWSFYSGFYNIKTKNLSIQILTYLPLISGGIARTILLQGNRSWGAVLLSLLNVVGFSIKFTAKGFGWVSIRFWYVMILDFISSFTVGSWRSECNCLLVIYHGELVTFRRVLDWNRCRISILEFEAVPHSWIPYVHMGFIMHL